MKGEASFDRRRITRWLWQGVALGGIATALVFVFTVQPETWEKLRGFDTRWLPVLAALVGLAWLCNGARVWLFCRALGHRLRYRDALTVSLSTEFGIAATPAGVGGAVLRLSLLKRHGVPVAHGGTMLASDAAVDLLFFALLTPFALWVLLHDRVFGQLVQRAEHTAALPVFVGALATLSVLVLLLRSGRVHRRLARLAGATEFGRARRFPARHRFLRMQATRTLRRMREAVKLLWLRRRSAVALNFLVASVQWTCRYSLLPLVLLAAGTAVNPLPLFLVQGLLFMLSMLVVAPGGGGAVEVLAALILPAFVPLPLVGVVVLVWRFFSYHLYLLGGGTAFFLAGRREPPANRP